jgi:glyoxylase-like metal-dependent hydrolase (beta-lactamase superfamily II)
MRCLLVKDEGRLILIDTGIGNKQDAKFFGHYYLHGDDTLDKSLATHGFHPDDITDVLLTHLHFDHCGGAIVRDGDGFKPAFRNATYWSNETQWKWATQPNDRERASFLKDNILPIESSGRLKFIPIPEAAEPGSSTLQSAPFTSNISVRIVNGHTKAMMLPQIRYGTQTIVYMADLLPSAAHIPIPYVMAYDMFPLQTLTEKRSFLGEAVENGYILYFEHDAQTTCCNLRQTEKGIQVADRFTLGDIAET